MDLKLLPFPQDRSALGKLQSKIAQSKSRAAIGGLNR